MMVRMPAQKYDQSFHISLLKRSLRALKILTFSGTKACKLILVREADKPPHEAMLQLKLWSDSCSDVKCRGFTTTLSSCGLFKSTNAIFLNICAKR